MESDETVVSVAPPTAPGRPTIQAAPCPETRRVLLTALVPNAVVVLSTVVPHATTPGMVVVTPIGEATASAEMEEFDLPADVEPVMTSGDAVL